VPVKLPRSLDSRRDEVTLHFDDEGGKAPADVATSFDVIETPKPVFAFSVQVDDRKGGNGDGLPQRGETFTLRVDVRNEGPGAAGDKTFVSLKNLGDEKLFIKKGREVVGALRPGEAKTAAMEIELKRGSKSESLPVRIQVYDEKTGEYVSEKLEVPISSVEEQVAPATGAVKVEAAEALIRGGAGAEAPVVATAKKGAVLPATGLVGGFHRVEWQKGRFGFVAKGDVAPARGPRSGAIAEAWQREPPRIALNPDPARGAPVVDGERFKLSGTASVPASADPDARLRDVYVFVNDEKVFFRVVPEGAAGGKLDFTADLPLKPGFNLVSVVAREDQEFQSRRSVVVYRRLPAEVAEGSGGSKPAVRTP
jgi:carboxyl-terminal processing protease